MCSNFYTCVIKYYLISVRLCHCLSLCVSVCLTHSLYGRVCVCVCVCVCVYVYVILSVSVSASLSVCLSLSACLPVCLSVCPSLSFCLFVMHIPLRFLCLNVTRTHAHTYDVLTSHEECSYNIFASVYMLEGTGAAITFNLFLCVVGISASLLLP